MVLSSELLSEIFQEKRMVVLLLRAVSCGARAWPWTGPRAAEERVLARVALPTPPQIILQARLPSGLGLESGCYFICVCPRLAL